MLACLTDFSCAISDINHIVTVLPPNTRKIIRPWAAYELPICHHCRAASKQPCVFVVECKPAASVCPVQCRLRAIVVILFPVLQSLLLSGSHCCPFPCHAISFSPYLSNPPVAFSTVGCCLKLSYMSDSHSKSLKVNFMFVPWPLANL